MSVTDPTHPPRWPLKVLRFFMKKEYLEEIEGDMEEVFQDNLTRFAPRKARRIYSIETLKLLRPILIKNFTSIQFHSQQAMYANYFKISLRGLMRNPLNSFINVFGLAASIGICVFAYAFARWTYSTDQFHKNKNEVYLVTFFAEREGTAQQYGTTPAPLGELLREEVPQITKVCRVEDGSVVVKHNADVFHERIRYADPEFLDVFTFPLKWGTAASLRDQGNMIISEETSIKYFGDANPVGSSMLVKFDQNRSKEFRITGVAAEFPKARTIAFNFLVNFENLRIGKPNLDLHDWRSVVNATLIQVENPADLPQVQRAVEKYRKIQNEAAKEEWAISSFVLEPLATLHERSGDIRDDISRSSGSNYKTVFYLVFVCLLLFALACFNYINIAIATAAKRLKEIGVRKSIGASRKTVVIQFLTENLVIACFAMFFGVILAATFFIPGFEAMWSFSMDFRFSEKELWAFLIAVLLFTAIASGIYPAFYISRFQAAGILRGSLKFGQKNPITRVLLGLQLIVTCIFITGSILFTQNSLYQGKRPWGYDQGEAMYAVVADRTSFEQLRDLMMREADVYSVAGSAHHVGRAHATTMIHFPSREYEVDKLAVDARYFETLGLTVQRGRGFNDHEGSDRQTAVVNETLVKNMAWDEPVGKLFRIDTVQYEVIGVVRDFHSYNLRQAIRPLIFVRADDSEIRYLTLKVREEAEIKTYKILQDNWARLFPEIPFNGGLQEDVWGFYFEEVKIYSRVWKTIAFLAISLAMLGLYGLISLNVEGRVREFSIRKVLGARMKDILRNIVSQYAIMFLVALVIGAPLGHMMMSFLVRSTSPYHVPITYVAATSSCMLMVLLLVVTVSTQVRKVQMANPVDGLKVE